MTREEAINEIKSWAIPSKKGREVLETLIPELRESEDEKIRKALIEFLRESYSRGNAPEECAKWLVWLNRPKELKPVDYDHEMWKNCEVNFEGGKKEVIEHPEKYGLQKEQKPTISDEVIRDGIVHFGITQYQIDNWLKKHINIVEQKDQKSAENSTRTKIISRATSEKQVVLLSESDGNAEIGWDTRSLEDTKKLLEYGTAFINKQLGTKPAEWSEEDKTRLTNILIMLQEYVIHHYSKDDVNKSVDWLKALPERFNLQLKQEWGDEDKEMLDSTIKFVEHSAFSTIGKGKNNVLAWLKSLRPQPHWKPSEEQMKAFRGCIEDLQARAEAAVGGWDNFNVMIRLYEELKKL